MTDGQLLRRRERVLANHDYYFYDEPLHPVRGEGIWMWDRDGKRYLDCYDNVVSVGHCHPRVVEVLTRQARTIQIGIRGRAWPAGASRRDVRRTRGRIQRDRNLSAGIEYGLSEMGGS
jgi:hypothetical protein